MKLIYAKDLQKMLLDEGISTSTDRILAYADYTVAQLANSLPNFDHESALVACIEDGDSWDGLITWLSDNPKQAGGQ